MRIEATSRHNLVGLGVHAKNSCLWDKRTAWKESQLLLAESWLTWWETQYAQRRIPWLADDYGQLEGPVILDAALPGLTVRR